ncbi:unnamed protein product [Cylindrotheca closterium]|uniref:Rab-GAP TBC domain-containing protein n=1 Tax=Cylindrotheca closterium TaxID=2856 RepID=A0AAD2JGA2_9STRA|nr:unnamed protein product [Cylindrotheca closterium]
MHHRQGSAQSASTPLPSISECLFGPSKKCPKMKPPPRSSPNSSPSKPQSPPSNADAKDGENNPTSPDNSAQYDGMNGRWGDTGKEHNIDLAKLRRVCSQGIADEGSHRGVAWRALLGYLEKDNIHTNWPKLVPAKRELYQSLVQQYFEGPLERGKDLRGQLSKLLRDRRLRKKYNKLESWDNPNASGQDGGGGGGDNDDSDSVMSEQTMESNIMTAMQFDTATKIADRLPKQFQDAWKRVGILDLDVGNSEFTNQAVNLGINQLNISPTMNTQEEFEAFLEDAQLLCEVRKDVARTHPDLFFYLEPKDHLGMRRYGALERILFIWAKLNKGVRYVQGMNEIIGTIYYVLANDHNSDWANNAEADSYYLFHSLMMDMKDVFVPEMDDSHTGIQSRIANLQRLLKTHDPEVFEHLQEVGIDASFFAIRWLTTLLSREFLLPDTIRLWDSMFASTHKENFLRYACGTMVMMIRDDLLKGDFGKCLRLLQSYPPGDVDAILETSRSLYIYESQITLVCQRAGVSLHQALQTISPPPSIIMAFGMRGGLAPRISMASATSPGSATTAAAPPQGGLFGRVKNLWNKNVSSQEVHAPIMASDSGGSQDKNHDEEATSVVTTTTAMTAATEATGSTAASSTVPPVSRIWNHYQTSGTTTTTNDETTTTTTTPPIPPMRRPIWNRGRSAGSAGTGNSSNNNNYEPAARSRTESSDAAVTGTATTRRNKFWKQMSAGTDG